MPRTSHNLRDEGSLSVIWHCRAGNGGRPFHHAASGHRVETDSALRELTVQAIAVRQTDPVFATHGVHLLLLGVTCDRWRAVISLSPFYCGSDFSIIECPVGFRLAPSG